jgi:RNA polymerase sigma factor (sigma-70 family)
MRREPQDPPSTRHPKGTAVSDVRELRTTSAPPPVEVSYEAVRELATRVVPELLEKWQRKCDAPEWLIRATCRSFFNAPKADLTEYPRWEDKVVRYAFRAVMSSDNSVRDLASRYVARLTWPKCPEREDIAQEVCAVFFAQGESGKIEPHRWKSYLFGIALRVILNARRKTSWRRIDTDANPDLRADSRPLSDDWLDCRQKLRAALNELEGCNDTLRTIMARRIDGEPFSDIANAVGLSEQAVKERFYRARARVETRLAELGFSD